MSFRFTKLLQAIRVGISVDVSVPSFYLNLSSPTGATILGAQGRGTIISASGGNITARVSTSRTSGCAPLYVNTDAYGTTKVGEDNPDHTLFFMHDYGDAGAGVWANGVQSAGLTSKNYGYGPVAGHVYETSGTFNYTLTVMDGAETKTVPGVFTVLDPDVVYAGTKTICISNTGNFAGAPTGAQQINVSGTTGTDMYGAWNNLATKSDRRILFCKSDTWVASAVVSLQGLTGTYLSGYGTGVAHSFASGTLVTVTPNTGGIGMMFEGGGSTDCKVCNFLIMCNAAHYGAGATTASSNSLLFYKVEVRGATAGFSCTTGGSGAGLAFHDQHCIYECSSDQLYGYAGLNPPAFTGASGAVGTPGIFTAAGHKFQRFNKVRLTGTPPAGLTTVVDYYIASTNLTANTFSLNAARDTEAPLAISGAGTCDVTAQGLSGGIGAFVSFRRGGFMGNYLDSCNHGEQTLRMPYMDRAHVNNNYIARPNQTKNVLKIHCRGYDELIGYTSGYAEKMVITANVMDLRGGYSYNEAIPNNGQLATELGDPSMVIGNGGVSPGGERVRNVIVQHNYTYTSEGAPKNGVGFVSANCPKFTVRNNIGDFTFGSNRGASFTTPYAYTSVRFVSIATSTPDQTAYVRVYNNSMYSNIYNAEMAQFATISGSAVNNYADVDDVVIKNNLWYTPFHNPASPSWTRTAMYVVSAAFPTNVVLGNNTDTYQTSLVSPNFTATPPVSFADWKPASGSYAIRGSGTPVLLKDFNMASRTGGFDHLGAILP